MKSLREALELPLMFHAGGPWDEHKRRRWKEITGSEDASTKTMCDHIRRVLEVGPQAQKALQRPSNFEDLSPQQQWEIDKELGILDWDGDPRS